MLLQILKQEWANVAYVVGNILTKLLFWLHFFSQDQY